jgi:hypothetical protein
MTFQVSDATIDVITRAAIKYRFITHGTGNMLGAELIRLNALACVEAGVTETADGGEFTVPVVSTYVRTPFPRKVKRAAIDGALRCWLEQVSGSTTVTESPAYKLVQRVKAKNDLKLGLVSYLPDVYDEDGEFISRGERITAEPDDHGFWDIVDTEEGREAVMIRPREAREAEARERLAARQAEYAAAEEARRQAENQRIGILDDDMDDDEWDEDDDLDNDE